MIDIKQGVLLTCSRCGKTKFVETDGNDDYSYYDVLDVNKRIIFDGWKGVNLPSSMVLCPECHKDFEDVIKEFMGKKD